MPKRILIVDDDLGVLEALSWLFHDEGYGTLVARDGKEGIAKALAGKPDLIILDINMPRMDGLQALKEIRNTPELKDMLVVLLTVNSSAEFQLRGLKSGADCYMTKPFDSNELISRIRLLLDS